MTDLATTVRVVRAAGLAMGAACALALTPAEAATAQQAPDEPARRAPGQVEEIVTVTATRLPAELDALTTTTRVVTAGELNLRPGFGLDEALAWEPGFSLFRRTPARSAHPTTHGVNLRGIAPTGTSRALVLVDGAPLADAFGGWVQWDRLPQPAIERVEIAYGGGSAPWGNQALAGVVQIVTRDTDRDRLTLEVAAGSQSTWRAAAAWSHAAARLLVAARAAGTDGYLDLRAADRGAIDRPVAARGGSLWAKSRPGDRWTFTVDAFRTDRDNGTPAQTNRVEGLGFATSWSDPAEPGGWSGAGWLRRSRLESVFSAVIANRQREIPVLAQAVPATDVGASLTWAPRAGDRTTLSAGVDGRWVVGRSEETVLTAGFTRAPGGSQQIGGVWAGAGFDLGQGLRAELSARADGWRNVARDDGPSRTDSNLAPRFGIVWQTGPDLIVRAAGYGAFRAPTLNELYRQFRVGDVVTAANAELEPERAWGGEAGAVWYAGAAATALRLELSGYLNRLDNAIVNATIGRAGELTLRQRRNLGAARTAGLELAARRRTGPLELALSASRIWTRVLDADGPELVGNHLPQVPEWRLTASSGWTAPAGWSAMLALRATGRQYEDDRNALELAAGTTVDAAVEWPLTGHLVLALRGQNLFDERLETGRTPLLQLGPPRLLTAGLRWSPR